ncbi:MAG: YIP1 family protein [Clostridia bacterium]|nr:YIP1 family protein [Clostridia bacterium]
MKKALRVIFLIICIAALLAPTASALVPYSTYTYDIDGNYVQSPHAYVPDRTIDSEDLGLDVALDMPTDILSDANGNLFIADPVNGRILILNKDYTLNATIKRFVNSQGVPDDFSSPRGVFVKDDELYICDTENNRIVVFKLKYEEGKVVANEYDRIIAAPESTAFPEGSIYKPIACAVDTAGRIYVVSSTTNLGIISMNADGGFLGFLGAQKTAPSAWQIFWRMFQTKEQREALEILVPTEYNNLSIDETGFIYATISSLNAAKLKAAIQSKDVSGDYAPVKKLNAQGSDIMLRTGFWPPSGEVTVVEYPFVEGDPQTDVSKIIDVALGEAGLWTIVDGTRQRMYTYDSQGNLLYIFGDNGPQLGNNTQISSICYQGDKFLVLDKSINAFTIYKRTAYGEDLVAAIRNVEDRNYDRSAEYWHKVLLRNSNFDEAYIGIADSLYRAGNYEEAQEYYKYAFDAEGYSKSYAKIRKGWIEDWIILIPIVVVAVCVLLSMFFKYAAKQNLAGQVMKEKRSFKEATLYGFHVIFHPFDGFWDLKHEKRGNFKAGFFFVAVTILAYIYHDVGQSFWFDPHNAGISLVGEFTGVLVPLALWVISNWCLTTLFEGEGSFKDILLATCYSILPLPMMLIPATILTHIFTLEESAIVTLLIAVGYVWAGFLLFFGVMVTHDYTFSKNILTVLGTLAGMVIIMFLALLFSGLLSKIVSFFVNIYTELSLRV